MKMLQDQEDGAPRAGPVSLEQPLPSALPEFKVKAAGSQYFSVWNIAARHLDHRFPEDMF